MSAAGAQVLDDVAAILGRRTLGTVVLTVHREDLANGDASGTLAGLPSGAEGWICTGSAIHLRTGDAWRHVSGSPSSAPDALEVISAEFRLDGTSSLHLRRVGGALRAYRYVEGAASTGGVTAETLTEDVTLLSTEAQQMLRYRTYRKESPHPVEGGHSVTTWEPWVSRFTGFTAGKDNEETA